MRYILSHIIIIGWVYLHGFVLIPQPINDDICSAITLLTTSNNYTNGTNTNATTSSVDPIGTTWVGGNISHNVWYQFIAPSSGNVTITTDHNNGATLTDPQLA